MAAIFSMDEEEEKKAEEWVLNHKCYKKNKPGFHVKYSFTPTGIGNVVEVKCCTCKEKKNVTNYKCW